jgi:two-component system chemotaxis response regulator CheB
MGAAGPSLLGEILNRAGPLYSAQAEDDELIVTGRIYAARPDHHLLINNGRVNVARGPKENRYRPAIDSLFRSAAHYYGPQTIGVVLSGMLDDGTAGLLAVKKAGGIAVVQDPADARFPDMPQNAL